MLPDDGVAGDENSDTLLNLMAKLRLRDTNPEDYDRKIEFWTNAIFGLCSQSKRVVFTVSELQSAFAWKSNQPACLHEVVNNMVANGQVKSLDQLLTSTMGWFQWSYHYIWSNIWQRFAFATREENEADRRQYVLLSLLDDYCERVLNRRLKETVNVGISKYLVDWTTLCSDVKHISEDEKSLQLVVRLLSHNGQLATCSNENGEMILKFRTPYEKSVPKITDADKTILKLQGTMGKIEDAMEQCFTEIEKFNNDAKKSMLAKNVSVAKRFLRKRNLKIKRLEELQTSLINIDQMMHQLASSTDNEMVVDALKTSSNAFKNLAQYELNLDKYHEVFGAVEEALEQQTEMEDALTSIPVNEDFLEEELKAIMAAEKEKEESAKALPIIPETTPSKKPSATTSFVETKLSG